MRQRWLNTAGIGVLFGIGIGILVLLVGELPARLRQRWPPVAGRIGSIICGSIWGTLLWAAYHWFVLNQSQVAWDVLLLGGVGLAIGFSLVDWVSLPEWISVLLPAITTYLPIWLTVQAFLTGNRLMPLLYFEQMSTLFAIGLPMALLISLGGTLPLLRRRRKRGTPVNRMI